MELEPSLCPLCKRELGTKKISKHHLVPKSRGGKHTDTVLIHDICHRKIHSLFTERELKMAYYTIEQLVANEDMAKFIKWVAKKDIDYYTKTKQANKK